MKTTNITNKEKEILKLLYQFRFLNRIQIQAFLKHKNKKRINEWLKDLTEKEYLNRIYSNKFGENTKPAIYYIGINGIRFLKTSNDCLIERVRKLYRDKDRSSQFMVKSMLLADIYLHLRDKSDDETIFTIVTESDLISPDCPYNFILDEINPDLVFQKETKNKNKSLKKYYLLETIDETLPRHSIRKRIKNYFDFYYSTSWESNTQESFPTLLFICPTLAMLIYAKRFTKKLLSDYEDIDLNIQFAIQQEAKEVGITSEIWEEVK